MAHDPACQRPGLTRRNPCLLQLIEPRRRTTPTCSTKSYGSKSLAAASTLRLLGLADPPTAIFAVNNIAVVGVAEAARQEKLDIPGDLALVCFDDIEHVSRLYPFLTVMAQPAETYGTIATQLLLDRLSGRIGQQRRRVVVLPADLIVRKSSGALEPAQAEAG